MQVPVYDIEGRVVSRIEVSNEVFGAPVNSAVMHQAVLRQLANLRQGTVATKSRGEVAGGGRKPYRQKGTGRARRGSQRAPNFRGGGVAFGPQPRSYSQAMPLKMRRLAMRSALSSKLAEQQLVVVDELTLREPKTREMQNILDRLPVVKPVLILTPEVDENVYKSARNIADVKALPANNISIVDVLKYRSLILPVDTVRRIERTLGGNSAAGASSGEELSVETQTE